MIIPVYNARATLCRSVDSILLDRFRDYQLILVDDGSSDGSGALCDDYARRDHRCQVIHQANGGLSAARNAGLTKAHGEYVTFVDADDRIEANTLSEMMQLLAIHHDYDILEYPVYVKYGAPHRQARKQFAHREYHDMRDYWLRGEAYTHSYACNKIYRRELFNSVRFPEGKVFEDVYTLPSLLQHCHMVATTNVGLYYYYANANGITERADGKSLSDLLDAHLKVIADWCDANYYAHVLNIQLDVYEATGKEPKLGKITQYVKSEGSTKHTLKVKLSTLIGVKRLCLINKIMHKVVRRNR